MKKRKKKTEPAPEAAPEAELSPGLRRFLYFTACLTGGCILIVEILGAKMLAPYLGTSHFVWTAQIAVTLVALSAGYYAGGWWVDRTKNLNRLFYAIIAASVYLCATVPMVKPICLKLMGLPLEVAAMLASAFLFLIPLALLAMTGPFLVRMLTERVENVGSNMGRLTAISTLGSVGGALLIGFVLIPLMPNSVTMLATTGVLVALSAVYLIIWGRGEGGTTLVVALLIGAAFGLSGLRGQFSDIVKYDGHNWKVLHRSNSNYGELLVIETDSAIGTYRMYLNDSLTQNTYDPDTRQSRSLFTGALRWLAHAYTPTIDRVLCIGMGAGIVPMQFAEAEITTDVVEINGAIVPVAEEFFDFDRKKVNLTIGDGRQFLNQTDQKYDAILLDAFLGDSSPSHLMTVEAFAEMRQHLTTHGVLVINSFGQSTKDRQYFSASLDRTLRAAFGEERVVVHASGQGNVFFVAANEGELTAHRPPTTPDSNATARLAAAVTDALAIEEWREWYASAAKLGRANEPFFSEHRDVKDEMGLMWKKQRKFDPAAGEILRDDFNPVEFYDARNRDANRRRLVQSLHAR